MTDGEIYSAKNIQVLEGLKAVRKRPAMYIGDTGIRGLHHLLWEVVDNSIDESLAGYCNNIDITIEEDDSITVLDNGRGIPVDMHEQGRSALEVVLTVLHAGGKFDKGSYKVSGGLHGVGISCVNALSIKFEATVYRNGKIYFQEYSEGTPNGDVAVIGTCDEKTGTKIHFKPDSTIFTQSTTYNFETISLRLQELAYLNVGLVLSLTDKRVIDENTNSYLTKTYCSSDGLIDFIRFLDAGKNDILKPPIYFEEKNSDVPIQIAITYNDGYSENIVSYVNNIHTVEGGTHVTGFRLGLTNALKDYLKKNDKLIEKKDKVEIIGDDFREGLTAIISVKVSEPQFEGQTKTKLGNSEVTSKVSNIVMKCVSQYLEEHPAEAQTIIKKVILAAQARNAAKKARELVQRKGVYQIGGLPGKLADCTDKDPANCELFIVEGNSAGGTAKDARDRKYQAILPLRGKILNVEKAYEHKIYDSEPIRNMFTALGVSINDQKELVLDKLRYHKIIIMADADVDGSHIRTLIITFFYRYMYKLVENGYVYLALAPLYLARRNNEMRYCWNDNEKDKAIDELAKDGKKDLVVIQRFKGLGEMDPIPLWDTTMDPMKRILQQVTLEDAVEADRIISLLMGEEVEPRRIFIEENAHYAILDV